MRVTIWVGEKVMTARARWNKVKKFEFLLFAKFKSWG